MELDHVRADRQAGRFQDDRAFLLTGVQVQGCDGAGKLERRRRGRDAPRSGPLLQDREAPNAFGQRGELRISIWARFMPMHACGPAPKPR